MKWPFVTTFRCRKPFMSTGLPFTVLPVSSQTPVTLHAGEAERAAKAPVRNVAPAITEQSAVARRICFMTVPSCSGKKTGDTAKIFRSGAGGRRGSRQEECTERAETTERAD